jgi:hypothetical protein
LPPPPHPTLALAHASLQEIGEAQTAIDLATCWLASNGAARTPDAADVSVCLALALCDRAKAAMQVRRGLLVRLMVVLKGGRTVGDETPA